MSKSDKIRSAYLVVNCVGLRTFRTPLVFHRADSIALEADYVTVVEDRPVG